MTSVLVVEDDPDARELLRTALAAEGYEVRTAANGADALASLRQERPCIILLDLMMPVMDGWAFRREQVNDPDLSSIPVLCITAVFDPEHVARQLGLRCIRKPYRLEDVFGEVAAACGPGNDGASF
ncbi:MAG: response regulator [Acidobacteria bacterium]|nr:response regulator [Acidobacteriota bacterium]